MILCECVRDQSPGNPQVQWAAAAHCLDKATDTIHNHPPDTMKRPLSPDEDCCTTLTHHQERLSYIPEHEALLAAFPAATAQAASDPLDGDEDGSAEVEEDEGQLRRWKAEQANKVSQVFLVSARPGSAVRAVPLVRQPSSCQLSAGPRTPLSHMQICLNSDLQQDSKNPFPHTHVPSQA